MFVFLSSSSSQHSFMTPLVTLYDRGMETSTYGSSVDRLTRYRLRSSECTAFRNRRKELPSDVPKDIEEFLNKVQEHLNNANTTNNTIYANNELLKVIKLLEKILNMF